MISYPTVLLLLLTGVVVFGLYRVRRQTDFFTHIPDLSQMERTRMHLYVGNLFDVESTLLTPRSRSDELISFDARHELYFARHRLLRKTKNEETIYDLQLIADRYQVDTRKLVKIATYADTIQWHAEPTVAKARHMYARTVRDRFCVLMRLRSRVHFDPLRIKDPIPFDAKKNQVIWRGGPSGTGFKNHYDALFQKPSREDALRRWCHNKNAAQDLDLGLIAKWNYKAFQDYLKPPLTIAEMRDYKYLLSIEGNDVASNLKWCLNSNSVVLMPRPRVESWFAESLLEPYVHYVPVKDDFSDLLDRKLWCDAHPETCKAIIANAHAFVQEFRNEEREIYLSFCVLQTYLKRVDLQRETAPTPPQTAASKTR